MDPSGEKQEQRLLLLSATGTVTLSIVGVLIGLLTGAKSIVFDGMYDAIDAGMTISAFFAARLIARGDDRRFQYGYWHIEPMLAFLNGAVLLFACIYGLVDGIGTVLAGGRRVSLDIGIAYAAVGTILSFATYIIVRRRSRGLGSMLLDLDARSWLLGGLLSAGLCVSFVVAGALEDTRAQDLARYVDPIILIILCLGMAPLPAATLFRAGREILQIAPEDLDGDVNQIAAAVAVRHGFVEHQSYVTRVGRAQFIEIGFVAPSAETTKTAGELDHIRQEIADAMGGLRPGYWLTIDFTADPRWI